MWIAWGNKLLDGKVESRWKQFLDLLACSVSVCSKTGVSQRCLEGFWAGGWEAASHGFSTLR